jgi:hypothetical protein
MVPRRGGEHFAAGRQCEGDDWRTVAFENPIRLLRSSMPDGDAPVGPRSGHTFVLEEGYGIYGGGMKMQHLLSNPSRQ